MILIAAKKNNLELGLSLSTFFIAIISNPVEVWGGGGVLETQSICNVITQLLPEYGYLKHANISETLSYNTQDREYETAVTE